DENRVVGFYYVCLFVALAIIFGIYVFFTVFIFGMPYFLFFLFPVLLFGPLLAKLFTVYPVFSSVALILIGFFIIPAMLPWAAIEGFSSIVISGLAIAAGVISVIQVYMKWV
ncbi:hypothetical protein KAU08_12880, partial [bacterium]|nr:hypothetical protein [bacterium]